MAATLNLQKECAAQGMKHVFGYTLEMEYEGEKIGMKVYAQTQRGMRNLLRIQKEIMVDSDNRTLSLQGLLTHGEGNVLVLGKLASYWIKKNPHILGAMGIAFEKVFYQVDLNEYKAERIDVEVLEATRFFLIIFMTYRQAHFRLNLFCFVTRIIWTRTMHATRLSSIR